MENLRMRYSTAGFIALILFAIGFTAGFFTSRKYSPSIELPVVTIQRDTVTTTDTLRMAGEKIPYPVKETIIRVDTVRLQINPATDTKYKKDTTSRQSVPDTVKTPRIGQNGEVLIPIESRTYQTDQYKAVISGWRPSLDTIEVYQKTNTITERRTETRTKRPWIALTAGGGVGYTPQKQIVPYAGVGIGLVLWSK